MARQDECYIGTILFVVKRGTIFVSVIFTEEILVYLQNTLLLFTRLTLCFGYSVNIHGYAVVE